MKKRRKPFNSEKQRSMGSCDIPVERKQTQKPAIIPKKVWIHLLVVQEWFNTNNLKYDHKFFNPTSIQTYVSKFHHYILHCYSNLRQQKNCWVYAVKIYMLFTKLEVYTGKMLPEVPRLYGPRSRTMSMQSRLLEANQISLFLNRRKPSCLYFCIK